MTDDGYIWLEQDHRDIEDQFQLFVRDNEEPVVRELCEHLTRHSQAEERRCTRRCGVTSTAATTLPTAHETSRDDRHDHLRASPVDHARPSRRPGHPARDAVSAHVAFEESEILPAMRACGVDGTQLLRELQRAGTREATR